MREITLGDFIVECPKCNKYNRVDNEVAIQLITMNSVVPFTCLFCGYSRTMVAERVSKEVYNIFFSNGQLKHYTG
jgi:transcription elongation factor Elf1